MSTFAHVVEKFGGSRAVPAASGVYLQAEDREMRVALEIGRASCRERV